MVENVWVCLVVYKISAKVLSTSIIFILADLLWKAANLPMFFLPNVLGNNPPKFSTVKVLRYTVFYYLKTIGAANVIPCSYNHSLLCNDYNHALINSNVTTQSSGEEWNPTITYYMVTKDHLAIHTILF